VTVNVIVITDTVTDGRIIRVTVKKNSNYSYSKRHRRITVSVKVIVITGTVTDGRIIRVTVKK
jgi:hypothetical protein